MEKLFNIDDYKDITSMAEFYDILGGMPENIECVNEIHLETGNCEMLKEFMLKNWKKNKQVKGLKKEYATRSILFDWVNYSPRSIDDMPKDVIRIGGGTE